MQGRAAHLPNCDSAQRAFLRTSGSGSWAAALEQRGGSWIGNLAERRRGLLAQVHFLVAELHRNLGRGRARLQFAERACGLEPHLPEGIVQDLDELGCRGCAWRHGAESLRRRFTYCPVGIAETAPDGSRDRIVDGKCDGADGGTAHARILVIGRADQSQQGFLELQIADGGDGLYPHRGIDVAQRLQRRPQRLPAA